MRLNKHIAESGYCSRREADRLIAARSVTVNGQVAGIGTQVAEGDEVRVGGQPLLARRAAGAARRHVYIALNKPVGITCTTEHEVAGNIVDFVDHRERIFPVGRLDKDSEGLILLTSNGDIVNEILRSENRHEKEYLVGVNKPVTPEFLAGMLEQYSYRVVVSVDARGGSVSLSGWTEATGRDVAATMAELSERGVERFLCTEIDVDGTMEGPAISELSRIAAATGAQVIASGGVGDLADLEALAHMDAPNVEGAIVGRALYERRFTVAEGITALR